MYVRCFKSPRGCRPQLRLCNPGCSWPTTSCCYFYSFIHLTEMVYLKGNMQIPKEDASLFVQRSESRQYKMMEWLGYTNKQIKSRTHGEV
jgi:hypothetical protein